MITALFIYDSKGDILISKLYKDGVKRNISDVFRIQVISQASSTRSKEYRSPVLTLGSTSFVYIKLGKVWICAVTRSNQDCSLILEFLYKFESLLRVIVGGDKKKHLAELTDEHIVNNFALVYEILGEVIEFGYPINLDLSYLRKYVDGINHDDGIFRIAPLKRRPSAKSPTKSSFGFGSSSNNNNNNSIAKATEDESITWRSPGIKYRRNEIFLNVSERINVLMNSQSDVLRSYVDGSIQMKTHLSGMPLCRFGFNDNTILLSNDAPRDGAVTLEDSKFHQCVQLNIFETERTIQFIPPDGEFRLMGYNCTLNINIPFKVYPQIQQVGRSKLMYKIRIKSFYPEKLPATNVILKIPTPRGAVSSNLSSSIGKSKFLQEENLIVWKCNKFFGDQEHVLTAEVELDKNSDELLYWTRPPITLDFLLDMFSTSGLTVKFLRVQEKSNYRTVKWVKYSTQAGSYEIRY
ncbi:AP-2 complex subunit mu [Candida viswanathii]|uniref:AP-2 complex subunit mu n=1 Tax=Candida viswanathii TaxID=5486 RepID=A0A367XP13_9ASCO|nr:AP-2 complex subunit mu [Candida viswanathii]